MMTQEQEIQLWELMAKSMNLEDAGDDVFIGDCPFCNRKETLGIVINQGFVKCLVCQKKSTSLIELLHFLLNERKRLALLCDFPLFFE